MAAQLGQQMLLENDELRGKCENLEKQHKQVVEVGQYSELLFY